LFNEEFASKDKFYFNKIEVRNINEKVFNGLEVTYDSENIVEMIAIGHCPLF